jgi:transcriptional regulator GlxA family with amidase domain
MDLALAMVEEDCGRGVAAAIARKLIFFYLNKQAYQVQFGTLVDTSPIAVQLKEWLAERLHESLDVGRLAEKMNMSPRNFTRVFTRQTGISPAKFIEKIRVEAAQLLVDKSDEPLEQIAARCGLGGLVSMRRLFLRHLMVTPSDYRRFLKLQKYENCN